VLYILTLLTLVSREVQAQSMWVNQQQKGGLALEYLRPAFDGDDDFSLLTGVYVISVRAPMSGRMSLVGELPVVHVSFNNSFLGDFSDDALGNPYIGVAMGSADSGTLVEIGAHLPLAGEGDGGVSFGYFGDFDRFEMYIPEAASLGLLLNHKRVSGSGTFSRLRVGPRAHIPTGSGDNDIEASLAYGFAGGFGNRDGTLTLGITGRWLMTNDGGTLGENTIHQATLDFSHRLGPIRAGLQLRVPVDSDLDDVIKHVLGLNVTIPFN
jgi:hypothetical protein